MNDKKTIAITGATSGIGLATSEELLKKGHHLIFFVRNTEKAQQLIAKWDKKENVKIIKCDLADLKSVRQAAEELLEKMDQLDVLINNAGGTFNERFESKDGFELHLTVNHLGHFLLTKILMPLLEKSNTTVINVSSEAHRAGKPDWSDLNLKKKYSTILGYGNAKLYNILFTKSLADKGLTSYALHPGVIDSGFGDQLPGLFKLMWKLGKPFMKTSREGASTSIYLATNDLPTDKNGAYFKDKKVNKASSLANSQAARDRLWEESEKMVEGF
ncbi:short-chain dehydrogenase [Marivirga tractuosa]|uniref:Short-chain dehydrogenase/reductase SDR n=1 Tax=Marivirga tractuosa (strain ATCC 23168 / DSM 4126 / NBRC 15989 / NCIMB 1408 / VKM B-1430 / H-43) TaxID=643867 RepID=E4TKX0_MARTH|nr:SDR family oxidoreductase [Marivirga tractuosa]ADR22273.1 short-chain dehydrogenase/reductase SDR [Marivirga tractuosa DSM 4126]BDD13261.1 short-chain dehydrogenase [Marivirga tractuosa]